MQDLIWFLLPVAAAFGWFAAQRSKGKAGSCSDSILGADYIKGLNYLLNEQQDKAIDVFIRMLEVNSDTVETHLALGNLFRKRGEVDRAIRIHQNLIARSSLNPEQRSDAVLELGQDYMKAGLFDRAEALFKELIDSNVHLSTVLPLLLDIYQQEKDWENAIGIADQMGFVGEQPAKSVIAMFYCELAENACARQKTDEVSRLLKRAGEYNPHCARARLIHANIARQQGDYQAALDAYEQVADQLNVVTVQKGLAQVAGGSSIQTQMGKVSYIKVGPYKMKDAGVIIIPHEGVPVNYSGLLGMNFLKYFRFFIDQNDSMLRLSLN